MIKSANISGCGKYRYDLRRVWDIDKDQALWVMLNPSTADARRDDPTIRRCISFSQAWGYGGLCVVNLYALRSTDPKTLYKHPDPIGPLGTAAIRYWATNLPFTLAAWGTHGKHRSRGRELVFALRSLGVDVHCLGITKEGHPKHPLYVPAATNPVPYDFGNTTNKARTGQG